MIAEVQIGFSALAKRRDMGHEHHEIGNLKVAFFLNLSFTLIEIVGGLLTNSVAVLSDALHDLGDCFSLGLAWFLERLSHKASDQRYSYGYQRFSLLGALLNALILIGGSVLILAETVPRLMTPQSFNVPGLIAFALMGIAANGLAVLRLRGASSINVRMVGWHLLEDVLGWAAVLIVGIVSLFVDVPILDPILSLLITAFVLYNVFGSLKQTAVLFLQGVPAEVDLDHLRERLLAIPGVESVHHMHLWSLDGECNVFTTHLVVPADTSKAEVIRIKGEAVRAVADLKLEHVTLEIEYDDEPREAKYHAEPSHSLASRP